MWDLQLVTDGVARGELTRRAHETFGDMVKAVVDVEKKVMVIGGELHSDEEELLLEDGSHQADLWGINIYPERQPVEDQIEFDSMINIRPKQGNRDRGVGDPNIRAKIIEIVSQLIHD